MLIAQLSDPHFLPAGTLAFGKVDTAGFLARAVAHLDGLALDAVLLTGDLTNDGDAAVYAECTAIIAGLSAPLFVLTGNHDDRELMRACFAGDGYLPADGPLCYAIEQLAVRVIALDSLVPGKPWGELGAAQIDWLDARLAEQPERSTLVAFHHPPFRTGIGHLDRSMLRDADALAPVIARHGQVERVICGHVHRAIQSRFAGTVALTAPSCAHQAELLLGEGHGGWICEPPAVLLHYWDATDGLVSHISMIGAYGPAGRFGDPHTMVG